MINSFTIIGIVLLYFLLLFITARIAEKKSDRGKNIADNPYIYSLSLTVYFTSLTFYGNIGLAVSSGFFALIPYLSVTVSVLLWWIVLRKMIRIKNRYNITSIADFISTRYNKSRFIAAFITFFSICGFIPYISLQLKSIFSTYDIINNSVSANASLFDFKILIVLLITLLSIVLGLRKLVPTEKHQGVIAMLAVDSVVKLGAIIIVGVFIVFFFFDGFGDIISQAVERSLIYTPGVKGESSNSMFHWVSMFIWTMIPFFTLPRQFHITVVENFNEKHLKTAIWFFPLYTFLMALFVIPIAMGGVIKGYPMQTADTFVLQIPYRTGNIWISLLVFLGGLSASFCMIITAVIPMAIMFANHILLPLIEYIRKIHPLKKYLLQFRWLSAALFVLLSFLFERNIGKPYMLSDLGSISFIAVVQFAPSMFFGMFFKKGNSTGAKMGLVAGFVIWFYTLIVPLLCGAGILTSSILTDGPYSIGALIPVKLFGFSGVDMLSHGLFWSLLFNLIFYFFGSFFFKEEASEQKIAESYVDALKEDVQTEIVITGEPKIELEPKKQIVYELLSQFFSRNESNERTDKCFNEAKIKGKKLISIIELAELKNAVEHHLAASIGSSVAHHIIMKSSLFTKENEIELKEAYTGIIADYKLSPSELLDKVNYFGEREKLLLRHADELEDKINELKFRNVLLETQKEASFEGILIVDEEGKILSYNKVFLEIWNIPLAIMETGLDEIVLGKAINQVDNPDGFIDDVKKIYAGKNISRHDEIRFKDGRILERNSFPMFGKDGKYYGRVWYFMDITERKRTEAALFSSEKKYSGIFRYAADIIGIVRVSDNKFIEINESFRRTFGYSDDEVIGHSSAEFGLWIDKRHRDIVVEMILNDKSVRNIQVQWKCKSGAIREGLLANELVEINAELCYVFVFQDITERIKSELEIKKLNAELEQRVKNRTLQLELANKDLEAFAYSVSHDLRAPLRSIEGFSAFLFEDYFDLLDETGKDYLKRLRGSAVHMGELIDNMLLLSRVKRSELNYSGFNLSEICRSVFDELIALEPGRLAEIIITKGLFVNADPEMIKIAMTNLLSNALKYSSKKHKTEIEVGTINREDKRIFYVKDNGAGFDMTYAKDLFTPFKRLHSAGEFSGTGIGLATVHRIIQRHGGEIWAESEIDKGAVFYFTLPISVKN